MKSIIWLCIASAVAMFACLFFYTGLSWQWAATVAILFAIMLAGAIDWTFDRINIFIPLRDRLVADWREAWRWFSVQLMAAAGFIELLEIAIRKAWLDLPPAILAVVPADLLSTISIVLLCLGIVGRVLKQKATA